jgi:hypothetical protein
LNAGTASRNGKVARGCVRDALPPSKCGADEPRNRKSLTFHAFFQILEASNAWYGDPYAHRRALVVSGFAQCVARRGAKPLEMHEPFLVIKKTDKPEVVTVMELLSPTKKHTTPRLD